MKLIPAERQLCVQRRTLKLGKVHVKLIVPKKDVHMFDKVYPVQMTAPVRIVDIAYDDNEDDGDEDDDNSVIVGDETDDGSMD